MNVIDMPKKDEMRAALESLKRELPTYLEYMACIAKAKRAAYEALVKEGFTPEQAIELCKGSLQL